MNSSRTIGRKTNPVSAHHARRGQTRSTRFPKSARPPTVFIDEQPAAHTAGRNCCTAVSRALPRRPIVGCVATSRAIALLAQCVAAPAGYRWRAALKNHSDSRRIYDRGCVHGPRVPQQHLRVKDASCWRHPRSSDAARPSTYDVVLENRRRHGIPHQVRKISAQGSFRCR